MRHQIVYFVFLQLMSELYSATILRVVPSSKLELPCLMHQPDLPEASIIWKYNGNVVSDHVPGPVEVRNGGLFLFIDPITASSAGKYECVLKWNNMRFSHTYDIEVEGLVSYTVTATAGATVTLPCRFPPYIQTEGHACWFKDKDGGPRKELKPVESSSGDQRLEWVILYDNDWSVTLRDTVVEDAGRYQCETANGEKFSTVYLFVDAAPTDEPHSCSGFDTPWEPCQDENSRTAESVLKESVTEFSLKLYSHLRDLHPSANLLFSPISIGQLFSYLLLGARDNTRRTLETALFVPHDFHCVHSQMKRMMAKLATSVQMAYQIYYNPYMNLSQSFTNQSMQFYDSEPIKLLNNSTENVKMINSWVANKTNNKIRDLIDDIPKFTQLLLINAVAFNGQWKGKFEKTTETQLFTKLNGDLVSVPVLYELKYKAVMDYIPEVKAKVVKLALSGDTSLYILLPRSHTLAHLQMVEETMTEVALRQMIQQLKASSPQQVEITIPKIKLNVETNMVKLIKKLGLSSLFESPNLCGLYAEEKVVLNDAKHKAFLSLTEEGVEAGAATTVLFARSYPSFSAMRPFILLLWSDLANVPLFIGRVTEP